MTGSPVVGSSVTHRRYVPHGDAHYGGNLVDGAYVLGLFGDVATELTIRTDGDEGLLAGYNNVEDLANEKDIAKLGDVPGVGIKKARQIKSAAENYLLEEAKLRAELNAERAVSGAAAAVSGAVAATTTTTTTEAKT